MDIKTLICVAMYLVIFFVIGRFIFNKLLPTYRRYKINYWNKMDSEANNNNDNDKKNNYESNSDANDMTENNKIKYYKPDIIREGGFGNEAKSSSSVKPNDNKISLHIEIKKR
jgi:hypothetical protein